MDKFLRIATIVWCIAPLLIIAIPLFLVINRKSVSHMAFALSAGLASFVITFLSILTGDLPTAQNNWLLPPIVGIFFFIVVLIRPYLIRGTPFEDLERQSQQKIMEKLDGAIQARKDKK